MDRSIVLRYIDGEDVSLEELVAALRRFASRMGHQTRVMSGRRHG